MIQSVRNARCAHQAHVHTPVRDLSPERDVIQMMLGLYVPTQPANGEAPLSSGCVTCRHESRQIDWRRVDQAGQAGRLAHPVGSVDELWSHRDPCTFQRIQERMEIGQDGSVVDHYQSMRPGQSQP
jgi:hypothetical protein